MAGIKPPVWDCFRPIVAVRTSISPLLKENSRFNSASVVSLLFSNWRKLSDALLNARADAFSPAAANADPKSPAESAMSSQNDLSFPASAMLTFGPSLPINWSSAFSRATSDSDPGITTLLPLAVAIL